MDITTMSTAELKRLAKPFRRDQAAEYTAARAELDKRGWTIVGERWELKEVQDEV